MKASGVDTRQFVADAHQRAICGGVSFRASWINCWELSNSPAAYSAWWSTGFGNQAFSQVNKNQHIQSLQEIYADFSKKKNELIDSCDYSCETSSHASGKAGDRYPDNAMDQTPGARRVTLA